MAIAAYRARHPGDSLAQMIWWDVARYAAFGAFRAWLGFRWVGAHNVPKSGPFLVVANHQSYLDPPAVAIAVAPRQVDFVARSGLFDQPGLGPLIASLHSIPLRQDTSDAAAMKEILRRLEQGRPVLMFPEGSRSYDGAMQPFKRGAAVVLKRSGCPVLPVGLDGLRDAWPRGKKPRLTGVRAAGAIGRPIPHAELLADGPDAALRRLEAEVDALRLQARRSLLRRTHGVYPPPGPADDPFAPERAGPSDPRS